MNGLLLPISLFVLGLVDLIIGYSVRTEADKFYDDFGVDWPFLPVPEITMGAGLFAMCVAIWQIVLKIN